MISENVKALAEKYCMGIKPTNEQLDEIMDAVFAADDEIMEVSEYIEALQNGPTKEMVEAEKKKEARKKEEETSRKAEDAKRKAEEEKKRLENMPKAKELYDKGKAKTKGFFSANYKEARVLFEESLALGYGDAAYEIANMYKIGIGGCEKNLQEYLKLIDRGIELHSSYVAEKAAKDFRIGSGVVPRDIMKSAIYEGIATGIRNKYE